MEVAIHDPAGLLTAIDFQGVAFPDDFDRSPDPLTVIAHTLVTLVRATDPLTRNEVREIISVLTEEFALDDMGDTSLRRILNERTKPSTAMKPSEVIRQFVPETYHETLVTVLYRIARAKDGYIRRPSQGFINRLLSTLEIHDHVQLGPEKLLPSYAALELEPGACWWK